MNIENNPPVGNAYKCPYCDVVYVHREDWENHKNACRKNLKNKKEKKNDNKSR